MQPKKIGGKIVIEAKHLFHRHRYFPVRFPGAIIVDSIQHYAQFVHRDPHDFVGECISECVVFPR